MSMHRMSYEVKFLTPAFLGNAEQNGQWRTPPFKALLRHWWRVAVAQEYGNDFEKMRQAEGRLFGHAWLKDGAGKAWASRSKVRLRLDSWEEGALTTDSWPNGKFKQVATTRDGKGRVRSDVYLGYGPVLPPSKSEGRKTAELGHKAIAEGKSVTLRLLAKTMPEERQAVGDAMQLMHWFGTLGSRSRNGWGSLESFSEDGRIVAVNAMPRNPLLNRIVQPWQKCLRTDWASGIGSDDRGPLIWVTEPYNDWWDSMNRFAQILVDVRRTAKNHQSGEIGGIHLLGYPAGGNWKVNNWGEQSRLASPLRFKVVKWEGKLRGMVFHVPYGIPKPLREKLSPADARWLNENQEQVWLEIHSLLDKERTLFRANQVRAGQ